MFIKTGDGKITHVVKSAEEIKKLQEEADKLVEEKKKEKQN